ncbi:MAG: hypothetical protein U9P36_06995 [Thermodesulfobacteriota bacterium]|nr:hypothetical protein [Thermodesulfobacteriota bacterium]
MMENRIRPGRPQVRAENPRGACGNIDHMTIDELKARAVGENFDGRCPACGMFHLTRSDIEILESEKISETKHYTEMKNEAEET